MRNLFFNEFTIGPYESSERDFPVPDFNLAPLTEKSLDQLHGRALPQIVRSGFKAEAQDCDSFAVIANTASTARSKCAWLLGVIARSSGAVKASCFAQ